MTIADYLRREWIPLQEASKKPSTVRGYRDIVENRLVPHLGDVRLSELGQGDIAGLYAALRVSGRRDGDGALSERSIKHTHAVLPSALEHAVDAGLLGRNPARRLPRSVRPAPRSAEMRTWSADQLRAFLASTEDDRLHACWSRDDGPSTLRAARAPLGRRRPRARPGRCAAWCRGRWVRGSRG